jgi:hypothetical protein
MAKGNGHIPGWIEGPRLTPLPSYHAGEMSVYEHLERCWQEVHSAYTRVEEFKTQVDKLQQAYNEGWRASRRTWRAALWVMFANATCGIYLLVIATAKWRGWL